MKRVTSSAVGQFFAQGKAAKNSNGQFYTDGTTAYSYGPHFVIARRLKSGTVAVNTDKVSATTSKHTSYIRRAFGSTPIALVSDLTEKLKRYDQGLMLESELLAGE